MKTPKAMGDINYAQTDEDRAAPLVGDALQTDNTHRAPTKAKAMGKDYVASPAKPMRGGKATK